MLIYSAYQSTTELISTMKSREYDVLLLDILMPGISGIQAANEIREFNELVKIIFLSSSPEFAVESYQVKAYNYLLKPVSKEKLFHLLDQLIMEDQKPQEGLRVKTQKTISFILFSRIVFVEVIQKKLYFHLTDGSVREINASLSSIEDMLLCRPEFVKIHRSYLVNLWHVSEISFKELITSTGKTLPVSRLLYGKVRKAYMEHLFIEKE